MSAEKIIIMTVKESEVAEICSEYNFVCYILDNLFGSLNLKYKIAVQIEVKYSIVLIICNFIFVLEAWNFHSLNIIQKYSHVMYYFNSLVMQILISANEMI
jgi:hypothetical protein